jgi:hypothetical protein
MDCSLMDSPANIPGAQKAECPAKVELSAPTEWDLTAKLRLARRAKAFRAIRKGAKREGVRSPMADP